MVAPFPLDTGAKHQAPINLKHATLLAVVPSPLLWRYCAGLRMKGGHQVWCKSVVRMQSVALLLFMSVDGGIVALYVCGKWHCCCLRVCLWTVTLLPFIYVEVKLLLFMCVVSGIVAVYVCGRWLCCSLYLWKVALLLFVFWQWHCYCLSLWTVTLLLFVCGEWHCCCFSVGSHIIAVYACGQYIVVVYICGQWHCCSLCVWTVIRKLVDGTCSQCEELCEGAESSPTDYADRLWTCRYTYFWRDQ
jgi:hypothetical protein